VFCAAQGFSPKPGSNELKSFAATQQDRGDDRGLARQIRDEFQALILVHPLCGPYDGVGQVFHIEFVKVLLGKHLFLDEEFVARDHSNSKVRLDMLGLFAPHLHLFLSCVLQQFLVVPERQHDVPDSKLPASALDAILVIDAFHEFTRADAILAGFYRALKPGGRLGVIDHSAPLGQKNTEYMERHHLLQENLIGEVAHSGLRLISFDADFAKPPGEAAYYFVVSKNPVNS
jgi:SAM-dependent methyltransferase